MGKVLAVCTSAEKGTPKSSVGKAEFIAGHGIKGDAHAGNWHRQVSLISHQKIEDFRAKAADPAAAFPAPIQDGAFGENLVVDGIDFRSLPAGTLLECNDVVLEITQIGKECHNQNAGSRGADAAGCAVYKAMGDCIMPREGVFAKVLTGGFICAGDEMNIRENIKQREDKYRVWIITASDRGAAGEREDLSGKEIRKIAVKNGYDICGYTLLSDDREDLEGELKRVCDRGLADLILTTGGTGFSPRDCMPEATASVAHRLAPGIAEAMRAAGMTVTKRAMLSRAIAAIRGNTLIINLPGSPKAAQENLEFIIDELRHGLDILTGRDTECAGKTNGN
ncbi:MAG: MOSC domain-containing protein [Treponema sp.]|nr:MOSC domain-containing protein [Treponema sp.]